MKSILVYLYLTYKFVVVGIKSAWEYKISFFVTIFSMFVNDILLIGIWIIFFAKFKTVNGWTFENTQILFANLLLGFSIAITFFSGVMKMAERISKGKIDTYLTQPKSVLFRMLTDDFQLSVFGDLLLGFVILFYVSIKYNYSNFIYVPIASVFFAWGMIVSVGAFALIGFWVKKFDNAANNYFWTLDAPSMYPQNSIIGGVKVLFLTAVPSLWYISFSYKFVKFHSFSMLGVVILYDIAMTLIMVLIFRTGIKKYESGNAIATND